MQYYENLEDLDMDIKILELKIAIGKEKLQLDLQELNNQLSSRVLFKDILMQGVKRISPQKIIYALRHRKKRR